MQYGQGEAAMSTLKEQRLEKKRMQRKRTEALKSVLIAVLAASFCFFAYSVKKNQKLIGGTSSYASEPVHISEESEAINSYLSYASPEYVMFNTEAGRDVFYTDSELYSRSLEILEDVTRSIFLPDVKPEEESENIFESIGEKNLLYVSYPYHRYPILTAQFFEGRTSRLTELVSSYKKVILLPSENASENIEVYIKDEKSEKVYKIKSNVPSAGLWKLLGSAKKLDDKNYSFAYELNLNKSTSTTLRSDILVPLKPQYLPTVSASCPSAFEKMRNGFTGGGALIKIIDAFGLSQSSIRQYIDKDNVLVCVSASATLKLYPDGILEYSAIDKKNGFKLSGNTRLNAGNGYFLSFTGVSGIINSLIPISANTEKSFRIRLTDLISESEEVAEYKFMFDYYLNGVRIYSPPYHSVEATVVDGCLTAMRIDLKTVESHYEKAAAEPLFTAIDRYCEEKKGQGSVTVSECSRIYDMSQGEKTAAGWLVTK